MRRGPRLSAQIAGPSRVHKKKRQRRLSNILLNYAIWSIIFTCLHPDSTRDHPPYEISPNLGRRRRWRSGVPGRLNATVAWSQRNVHPMPTSPSTSSRAVRVGNLSDAGSKCAVNLDHRQGVLAAVSQQIRRDGRLFAFRHRRLDHPAKRRHRRRPIANGEVFVRHPGH